VKLSATVMAHPVREAQVVELLDSLDREIPVSWDTAGPPSSDPRQRWANGRRAWEMHDPSADWHIVIQDDAVVVPDLLAGLEAALEHVPANTIVCPYVGTKRPSKGQITEAVRVATEQGARWLNMRSLNWGVAIAAPVDSIGEMLAWCSDSSDDPARLLMSYDKRIGVYYRDILGWRTWYPFPSLVDHRGGPSICGHSEGRVAHRMHDGSALDVDWMGPVLDLRDIKVAESWQIGPLDPETAERRRRKRDERAARAAASTT
jgi:hypothetical protein